MTAASAKDTSVDAAIDALYAGPLEAFVAARGELSKQLRAAGERAAADRVKSLPKPSVSAWAMNQLWWHERPSFDALLDAGAAVRAAQLGGAGPSEQASAAKTRRRCLDRLLACAEDRLAQAGHAAAAGTLRRIATSLEAAAAHGRAPIEPPPGRLHADLEPPGFEVLSGTATSDLVAAASTAAHEPDVPRPRAQPITEPDRAAIARAQAQADVAEAAREVDVATRSFDDAAIAAQAAAEGLAAARARADAAAREAAEAELRFRRAAKEADACRAAAQAAHERLRDATGRLARTDATLLDEG